MNYEFIKLINLNRFNTSSRGFNISSEKVQKLIRLISLNTSTLLFPEAGDKEEQETQTQDLFSSEKTSKLWKETSWVGVQGQTQQRKLADLRPQIPVPVPSESWKCTASGPTEPCQHLPACKHKQHSFILFTVSRWLRPLLSNSSCPMLCHASPVRWF